LGGGRTNEIFPEGMGTVFRINKDGTGYVVLHYFGDTATDGRSPSSELVEGRGGALFGTTENGGVADEGTVYKMNRDGGGYSVLRNFLGGNDGAHPHAGLCRASRSLGLLRSTGRAESMNAQESFLYGVTVPAGPA